MPCNDVTEVIQVVLDAGDRLESYTLSKRTCGQAVGVASLLVDVLKGRSVDELLAYTAESFLADYPTTESLEEFLALKHLFAVQAALEVLVGKEPGRKDDPCVAASVSQEGDSTLIDAQLRVELMTERIKSCGGCKSCGRRKEKAIL